MQTLFVLRHAIAEDLSDSGDDFDRNLTEEGINKTKSLKEFFSELNEEVDIVLTSPYVRARQTAELFIENTNNVELKIVDFLALGSSSNEIIRGLNIFNKYSKILIVGHAPDLEIFLGRLTGGNKIRLKKGALAKINLDDSIDLSGELEWLITSKLLKRLKAKI